MAVVNLDPALDNKTVILWYNHGERSATTVSAAGQLPGFAATNVIDPATYNSWEANSSLSARLEFAFNVPRIVKGVGIAAHTIGSSGATMGLRYSTDGATWERAHLMSPTTDEDIFIILPTNMQYQYWDLNFSVAAPKVGVVFMGPVLTFPSTPIDSYTPVHHSRQYTKQFNRSIQGQFLGNRVMGSGGTMSVQFPHITRSWVDGPLTGFEDHYNRGGTFFYAGWPGGKPQDMAYAWPGSEDSIIDVEYVTADKMATVGFDMQFYNQS